MFVIKYDFVLTEDITLGSGCVLKFDGGSINGGYIITGSDYSIQGNGAAISVKKIQATGILNVSDCIFNYYTSDSQYFIDIRGGGSVHNCIFNDFNSNCVNLEGCDDKCEIYENIFTSDSMATPQFTDDNCSIERCFHILNCLSVNIHHNTIKNYPGNGVNIFPPTDLARRAASHISIDSNSFVSLYGGGVNSGGGRYGMNIDITNNYFKDINNGYETSQSFNAYQACINIHGGKNILIEGNTILDSKAYALDIDGTNYTQQEHDNIIVKGNRIENTYLLSFVLGGHIICTGNVIKNMNIYVDTYNVLRITKPYIFDFENNEVFDRSDSTQPVIYYGKNSAYKGITYVNIVGNRIDVHNNLNYMWQNYAETKFINNIITRDGVIGNAGISNGGSTPWEEDGVIKKDSIIMKDFDVVTMRRIYVEDIGDPSDPTKFYIPYYDENYKIHDISVFGSSNGSGITFEMKLYSSIGSSALDTLSSDNLTISNPIIGHVPLGAIRCDRCFYFCVTNYQIGSNGYIDILVRMSHLTNSLKF